MYAILVYHSLVLQVRQYLVSSQDMDFMASAAHRANDSYWKSGYSVWKR
jgi:hypothetical protein